MNSDPAPAALSRDGPIRLAVLLGALAAGPTAWALQLIAGYGFSSLACFPRDAPSRTSPPQGWSSEPAMLLAINLAFLLLALAGGGVCLDLWKRARGDVKTVSDGRTRFLAICGLLSGLGFALAILFDTAAILGIPTCWTIPS